MLCFHTLYCAISRDCLGFCRRGSVRTQQPQACAALYQCTCVKSLIFYVVAPFFNAYCLPVLQEKKTITIMNIRTLRSFIVSHARHIVHVPSTRARRTIFPWRRGGGWKVFQISSTIQRFRVTRTIRSIIGSVYHDETVLGESAKMRAFIRMSFEYTFSACFLPERVISGKWIEIIKNQNIR